MQVIYDACFLINNWVSSRRESVQCSTLFRNVS